MTLGSKRFGGERAVGLRVRDVLGEVRREADAERRNLHRSMREYGVLIPEASRGPLRLDEFPFQVEPFYDDAIAEAEEVVYQKSTQIGASTGMIRWAIRLPDQFGETAIYFFPTDVHVREFGAERLEPSIASSEYLSRRMVRGHTRNKSQKQIGLGFLNLRGMQSKAAVQSIAAQAVVIDEYDECPPQRIEEAENRISGAEGIGKVGRVRRLGRPSIPGYGIDAAFCLAPSTPVLLANLTWKPAGELKKGEKLLAFDEENRGARGRCFRATQVIGAPLCVLPAVRITLDDGQQIEASEDHRWLVRSATNLRWKRAKSLVPGDQLCTVGRWTKDESRSAGWLAGIFDGEGYVSNSATKAGRPTGFRVGVSQNHGETLEAIKEQLAARGFVVGESKNDHGCVNLTIKGGLPECLRFLGTIRPERLVRKAEETWPGLNVGCSRKVAVAEVESLGDRPVVALATKEKTLIADGILSHNSESDQRSWMVTCPECHLEQRITFADNLRWRAAAAGDRVLRAGHDEFEKRKDVTKAWRACAACDASLEGQPIKRGRWVAQSPGPGAVPGFHIPRLIVPRTDLRRIVVNSRKTKVIEIETFHNADLGEAWAAADARLTDADLERAAAQGLEPQARYVGRYPVTLGLDVASERDLNCRISEVLPDEITRRALRIWEPKDVEEVMKAMEDFRVHVAVVDSMPERRGVGRALQNAFPGRVFLAEYDDRPKADAWKYDEKRQIITVNRTEALDAMMDAIRHVTSIPTKPMPRGYVEQMKSPVRKLEEDTKGRPFHAYRKTGTQGDDYAHAEVYDLVALEMLNALNTAQKQHQAGEPEMVESPAPVKLGYGHNEYDPGFGSGR